MVKRSMALVLAATLGATVPLGALEWPTSPVIVAGEFGSPNGGCALPGLLLRGDEVDVRAVSAGELSFSRALFDRNTVLPSAFGDIMAVDSPDGIAAVYAYLPGLSDPGARNLVQDALIAKTASAGLNPGKGFFLGFFDRKAGRWVNPRIFLPPLSDKKAPSVRKITLEGASRAFVLGEQKSIPQGTYALAIEAVDQMAGANEAVVAPPFFLRVVVNGAMKVELRLEVAATREGLLSFYPDRSEERVDLKGRVCLPPMLFARGRTSIEVLIRDYAGNERLAAWTFVVE